MAGEHCGGQLRGRVLLLVVLEEVEGEEPLSAAAASSRAPQAGREGRGKGGYTKLGRPSLWPQATCLAALCGWFICEVGREVGGEGES